MKSTFGKNIRVSIWGGSHEPAIGADISGIPVGTRIDMNQLEAFLRRRAPGNNPFGTKRKEPDIPVPVSGLSPAAPSAPAESADSRIMEVTAPDISLEIRNTDTRSSDYRSLRTVPRPGHADYTARLRYGDDLNMAGGGPFSARMTAPLCIAGGIALQLLQQQGIEIGAHIASIDGIKDTPIDPVNPDIPALRKLRTGNLAVMSDDARQKMEACIIRAGEELDSVGGTVEACVVNLPGGIGGAMYDGLESVLAPILFGIPAVKGVEFGSGFGASELRGSENNDPFYYDSGQVKTRTNNHGGILGGITTGMPLMVRLAFKPTPSISRQQDSVDLETGENTKLIVKGRHDPCVVPRAVPIVEAALAIGILDCMMEVNND